ncbi:MAG TPA: GNAT family N-acetyltransferase [Actinomycetota bacterium]|jgi:GNAT superfamily N-acetyltransferase|nr:GNAT family N-acetyltransferase [Actinomycetota bacterium]
MPSPVRSPRPDAVARTRGGVKVRLRPQRRDDRDLLAGFFAALSPASRHRRFLQPLDRLPEGMLRHLLAVDGYRHAALVATVGGECVGIARYIALSGEPGVAEVALTVADHHQGRGIGRLLVEALRAPAASAGIRTFVYLVHPENRAALGLLHSLGVQPVWSGGLFEGREPLPAPAPAAA